MRAAVGDDCAIAVRIAADTLEGSGVELEEGLEFIRRADPMVDLWDVTIGALSGWERVDSGPSRFFEQGYQLEWSGQARRATGKPIVVVGRFTDPDRMAEIVRGGSVDLIGAARPSISDPFLPRKIEEGRYDEIRECIGCNACYSRSIWGRHLGCTQNATAGEEHRRGWHPERFERAANAEKTALVIGSGPAGMECAIVLARRGLELVHVVDRRRRHRRLPALGDAAARAGGVGAADRLSPGADRPAGATSRSSRARACGRPTSRGYGADIVVVATGARSGRTTASPASPARPSPAPARGSRHVLTPEQ